MAMGWCLCQYYVYLSRHSELRYTAKYYKQHRFVIAALSGTMGAQNVLFAKSVSVLVIESVSGGGRVLFAFWETYLLLIGLVSTIYLQLRWLNSGLKRFSALYVAPTFQAFWITVSVVGGLVVYDEADDMNLTQKCVFPLGVVVTILGVFYLTTQGQPERMRSRHDSKHRLGGGHSINDHDHCTTASPSSSPSPSNLTAVSVEDRSAGAAGHSGSQRGGGRPILAAADGDEDEDDLSVPFDSTVTPLIAATPNDAIPPPLSPIESERSDRRSEHGLMGLIKNLGDLTPEICTATLCARKVVISIV